MFIDRESNVTLSGDVQIGAVEIKDYDSDVRADVTAAGLAVDIQTPDLIGDGVQIAIDGTERRLDMTPLVGGFGYPMRCELEARAAPCYLKQGDSAIVLSGVNGRLRKDEWRIVTVSGIDQAYMALKRESTTVSGTLVVIRTDK
jgi:hypothetical protein